MKASIKETLAKILTALKQIKSNPVYVEDFKTPFTSTGTGLTYTGANVTIPANCYYVVTVRATYTNAKPNEVAINTSSTNANANVATGSYAGVMSTAVYAGLTSSNPLTLYVWAKYSAATTQAGNIYLTGFYIRSGMVGGVLRNPVIATLTAIFTSLLFGGDVDEGQYKEATGESVELANPANYKRKNLYTSVNYNRGEWNIHKYHFKYFFSRTNWIYRCGGVAKSIRSKQLVLLSGWVLWEQCGRRTNKEHSKRSNVCNSIVRCDFDKETITISERRWAA